MASQAYIPISEICSEKRRLTNALYESVHKLVTLHAQQAAHLVNAGDPLDRFDLAIGLARRREADALRALARHLREHHC